MFFGLKFSRKEENKLEAIGLNSAIQTHIKVYVTGIGVRWKVNELPNFVVRDTQLD
jgi:hypothetical protein